MTTHIFDFPIVVDNDISIEKEWVFPKHEFFEYEPKDEKLCRALGIGYERLKPKAFFVNRNQCGIILLCNKTFEVELRKKVKHEQGKEDSVGGHGRLHRGLEHSSD